MLSREENELLCRVEPGFPMHEAFKRYWLVAGLSSDHPRPDSDPKRSTILGEDYVLFRDSNGRMGCLDELCCHRGASLCLGRVEGGGIRCIFHGWQFDVDGKILDMPNATDDRFKQRYRQPSYPVVERGGLIWVYLGLPEQQPPVPNFKWLDYPPERYFISAVVYESNFTQAIDGGADSSHLTILHQDALKRLHPVLDNNVAGRILADAAPSFDTYDTEFGQFSAAIRTITKPDGSKFRSCKSSAFIAPSTVLVSGSNPDDGTFAFFIPVTSTRTIAYLGMFDVNWKTPESAAKAQRFMSIDPESLAQLGYSRETCDNPERPSRENNWHQDREGLRNGRFTGLVPFIPEDVAVSESMGAIYDRKKENLVPSDLVIVRIRRILMEMARDVQAGRAPIGLRTPIDQSRINCHEHMLEDGEIWHEVMVPPEFLRREPVKA